jgi:YVTN family beta-propeller protein
VKVPQALRQPGHITTGDRSRSALVKATAGLALVTLIVSGCGSTAVPSSAVNASPASAPPIESSAVASPKPSIAASVPATPAVIASMTPVATVAAPNVGWLASDGTMLWVVTGAGQVARLDPTAKSIGPLATVDATHQDGAFAVNGQGLWLNDFDENLVYRVDPTSLKVVAKIDAGPNPEGLAVDPKNGAVWVADHRGGTVERIDPATNKVVAAIPAGNKGPSGPHQVGIGLGTVWVGVPNTSSIYRIDPATNKVVATIEIPVDASPCSGFAFSKQAVWTPSCFDAKSLVRIDPVGNKVVATIDLNGYGDDPILVDGFPWLVVEQESGPPARLVRIDPTTNAIDRTVSLGDSFRGSNLVVLKDAVWAIDSANGRILRLPLSAFSH